MNNKKWAKHIIKKFGKRGANTYTNSHSTCPCICLNYSCTICTYRKKKYIYKMTECKKGLQFYRKMTYDIREIKEIIKKRLG